MATPLPPGELERLAECVLEPIRFPGAVQRHGAVIIADPSSHLITHVSDNTREVLGAEPLALLGRGLDQVLDEAALRGLASVLDERSRVGNPVLITRGDREFDLIAHPLDGRLVIELEPHEATPASMTQGTRGAMRRLVQARSVAELWARTAHELRAITGFDRVMVYHFHPDQHGEVVAEARADDLESYLGLHYPASDIPAQARALYVTKLSRMIVDSHAEPAALLADAGRPQVESIDLSMTELRAVSPHHREFMRNMGQTSTFSLSLVLNGELVGMITCAHRTERCLPFNIRDGLEIFANQVSLQLASMREIERLAFRNEVREIRSAIVSQLARADDLVDGLLHGHLTVLDLIPADGAAIRIGDQLEVIGAAPDRAALDLLGGHLAREADRAELVSEFLAVDHPDLAAAMPGVAGLLVRRLGSSGDYLAWFRGERRQTVKWLGDMSLGNRVSTLSPRNSFSEWVQEVGGTTEPWGALVQEARELANDLQASLLQRAQSQLADLALRDPLTGLPDRRLFMDRLQQAIVHAPHGLAVLFLDIDRFKSINDEFGHAAGDLALIHVADAVAASARSTDTVARLGGDEFVVLAAGLTRDEARALADRILEAISADPPGAPGWRVSGSIGIAMVEDDETADASHLLSAADTAMYRAKEAGRGQVAD